MSSIGPGFRTQIPTWYGYAEILATGIGPCSSYCMTAYPCGQNTSHESIQFRQLWKHRVEISWFPQSIIVFRGLSLSLHRNGNKKGIRIKALRIARGGWPLRILQEDFSRTYSVQLRSTCAVSSGQLAANFHGCLFAARILLAAFADEQQIVSMSRKW